jgi:hypothetical protein
MAAGVAWLERCLGTCVPCCAPGQSVQCAGAWFRSSAVFAAMVGQLLLQRYLVC